MTNEQGGLNEDYAMVFKLITDQGIEHVIHMLESYSEEQQSSYLRAGDYKLAKNWKDVSYSLFAARKVVIIKQLK